MRKLLALTFAVSLAAPAAADDIQPATLATVKKATVYIRVAGGGRVTTGSGFVVHADGETALIITNEHVVVPNERPKPGVAPPRVPPPQRDPSFFKHTVIFDSGEKGERSVKAEVVLADPVRDLAVLRVTGVKDLPAPLAYSEKQKLVELTVVYSFGYPLGDALSLSKASPAVTVGKASISSLRENDAGDIVAIQLDGSLNPGNSGGPVVDSKGKLIGVVDATVRGSTGIGLAIPARDVDLLMRGRVGSPTLTPSVGAGDKVTVRVEVPLLDPLKKVESATLYYVLGVVPKDKQPEDLTKAAGVKKVELKIQHPKATGEFMLEKSQPQHVRVQVVYKTADPDARRDPGMTVAVLPQAAPKFPNFPNPSATTTEPPPPTLIKADAKKDPTILGGVFDPIYRDIAPTGGVLIGLEVGLVKLGNDEIVGAVRPIYLINGKERLGQLHGTPKAERTVTLKAKSGYAVGAANIHADNLVKALKVTFMKWDGTKLDEKDAYESDWVGSKHSGEFRFVGNGTPAIGVTGKTGTWNTGLGIMFVDYGETAQVGGSGDVFRDEAPRDGELIGFVLAYGMRGTEETVIKSLRPIYQFGKREAYGRVYGDQSVKTVTVRAKPGYVVGGVTVSGDGRVSGLAITFVKSSEGILDLKDQYKSEWYGGKVDGEEFLLGGDGRPVTGITGRMKGNEPAALGLLISTADRK